MASFSKLIASIDNTTVTIKVKANEKGHLFKAVSPRDVVEAIKSTAGVEIDEDSVVMDHIKELGTHSVTIKKGDMKGKCQVVVQVQ